MNEIFLSYELELDTHASVRILQFPHDREGFTQALEAIESIKKDLISAKITSTRDGVVYHYNDSEQNKTLNY
jgi:hypothetical protein